MNFVDSEKMRKEREKNKKLKKILLISMITLTVLIIGIAILIVFLVRNPNEIVTYIDGQKIKGFNQILDIQTDENGKTQIYIKIRDFAAYLNKVDSTFEYKTYKGDYFPKTEDENKCYIIRNEFEVAIFTAKSNTIYKLNLQKDNSEYEEHIIEKPSFLNNGDLYTSVEGIEKGYNVRFIFDEKTKTIRIFTLDTLIQSYSSDIASKNLANYGTLEIDEDNHNNWKTVFEQMLVVRTSEKKYGILKTDYSEFILEPQYDDIEYISSSKTFLVKSNNKVGLFSKEGKRKINMIYEEMYSMGKESNLYRVRINKQYGVVDENGQNVIYPQYSNIGIDISDYSFNNIKNGYILLDDLIPVKQDRKWGFYSIKNKKFVTNGFIYTNIGCQSVKSGSNIYPAMIIPECDVIVVGDELNKYWLMDKTGNDDIIPHVLEQIYLHLDNGKANYYMVYNERESNIVSYLNNRK